MRRIALPASIVFVGCLGILGCANRSVRAVYRDGEGGVMGIPQNTNTWPHYYRDQATRAMARHFPQEGYLIVREVEVPKGKRTTFEGATEQADISPLSSLVHMGKLGVSGSKNRGEQQSQQILETHIFYKRNDPKIRLATGSYAPEETYTPAAYDGPVAPRLMAQIESKLPTDPATRLAGFTTTAKARRDIASKEGDAAEVALPMPRPIKMPKLEMSP